MDVRTRARRKLPEIGRGASSIATDGDKVWITLESTREVVRFDARTGPVGRAVRRARPPGPRGGGLGRPVDLYAGRDARAGDPAPVRARRHRVRRHAARARRRRGAHRRRGARSGSRSRRAGAFCGSARMANPRSMRSCSMQPRARSPTGWVGCGPSSATTRRHGSTLAARSSISPTSTVARPTSRLSGGHVLITLHTANRVLVVDPRNWEQARRNWLGVEGNPMWMAAQGKHVFVTSGSDSQLAVLER